MGEAATLLDSKSPPPGRPDDQWARTICAIGQGAGCCRYLTMAQDGWCCEKFSGIAGLLNERASLGQMTARGDNCAGRKSGEAMPRRRVPED